MNGYGGSRYGSSYISGTYAPRSGFSRSRFDNDDFEPAYQSRSGHRREDRDRDRGHDRDYERERMNHDARSRASARASTVYPEDSISSADYRPRRHRETRREEDWTRSRTDDHRRTSRRDSDHRPSETRHRRSPSVTHPFATDGTATWTYHPPTMTEGTPSVPDAPSRHRSRRHSSDYGNHPHAYDSAPTYRTEPRRRPSRTERDYQSTTTDSRYRRSEAPSAESRPSRRDTMGPPTLPPTLPPLRGRTTRPGSAMSWEYTNLPQPAMPIPMRRGGISGYTNSHTDSSSSRGRGSEMSWEADFDYIQTRMSGL